MADDTEHESLWTPGELAAFLRLPEKTLRKWRSERTGPTWLKIGRHVRYEPEQVRNWLLGREEVADSP